MDIGGSFPFDTGFPWISTFFNESFFLCLACTGVEVLKAEKAFYSSVSMDVFKRSPLLDVTLDTVPIHLSGSKNYYLPFFLGLGADELKAIGFF